VTDSTIVVPSGSAQVENGVQITAVAEWSATGAGEGGFADPILPLI
jgi:hypothetical protein